MEWRIPAYPNAVPKFGATSRVGSIAVLHAPISRRVRRGDRVKSALAIAEQVPGDFAASVERPNEAGAACLVDFRRDGRRRHVRRYDDARHRSARRRAWRRGSIAMNLNPGVDGDRRRIDRGLVRNMVEIAEQELKSMSAGRQRDRRLGLAGAEMQMIGVVWNRLVERRQRRIDQKMVVPGIGSVDAGRRNAHADQPKSYRQRLRDLSAVAGIDEIDLCARRRRVTA